MEGGRLESGHLARSLMEDEAFGETMDIGESVSGDSRVSDDHSGGIVGRGQAARPLVGSAVGLPLAMFQE